MNTHRWLTALALFAVTGIAHAHAELSASMPADGATVQSAPKEIMLHFSQPVRLTMLAIQRTGEERRNLAPLPTATAVEFTVPSPGLSMGSYVIEWRALSQDTHIMTGKIEFSAGGAAAHDEHGPRAPQ